MLDEEFCKGLKRVHAGPEPKVKKKPTSMINEKLLERNLVQSIHKYNSIPVEPAKEPAKVFVVIFVVPFVGITSYKPSSKNSKDKIGGIFYNVKDAKVKVKELREKYKIVYIREETVK